MARITILSHESFPLNGGYALLVKQTTQSKGKAPVETVTRKDGIHGTGVTLPYICGFCRDKKGNPTMAFRSRRQRNKHAAFCPR